MSKFMYSQQDTTFIDSLYNSLPQTSPYKQKYFTKNISSDERNIQQWRDALPSDEIKTICDLTGNVGTESIFLTRTLPNIEQTTIYEIDRDTFIKLQENIGLLPKSIQDKIFTHNSTSENITDYYDLILFDPPWGGADYTQGKKQEFDEYRKQIFKLFKKHSTIYPEQPIDTVELKIGSKTVRDVVLHSKFGVLALKIPLNAPESPFSNNFRPIKSDGIRALYLPIIYMHQIKYLVVLYTRDSYIYNQLLKNIKTHHINRLHHISLTNSASQQQTWAKIL